MQHAIYLLEILGAVLLLATPIVVWVWRVSKTQDNNKNNIEDMRRDIKDMREDIKEMGAQTRRINAVVQAQLVANGGSAAVDKIDRINKVVDLLER